MTKLLPECSKCSSPVTDSLETEIEQHGKVKQSIIPMEYGCVMTVWKVKKQKKKGKGADNSSSPSIDQCDTIELQVHLMYPLILPKRMKPAYDNSSMSFHLFR